MVTVLSFCALALDAGHMYVVRAELQNAADAGAMAAAASLSLDAGDQADTALAAAQEFVSKNPVFNTSATVDPTDIELGQAQIVDGRYRFFPGGSAANAVRLTVRRTDTSSNGALPLFFAPIMGNNDANIAAAATAMLIPRDIAVVADLSASHSDDSELGHYRLTNINLHDVWASLPGGESGNDQQAGPTFGYMETLGWGEMDIDAGYDPTSDEGLVHLPKNTQWNDANIEAALAARNYSQQEINVIMGPSSYGDRRWKYRVGLAMGVADWRSGLPGGKWEVEGQWPGNGNSDISAGELRWDHYPYQQGSWDDYINGYMNKTWTQMYEANSDFKNRFGAKTFTNYLLERRLGYDVTPELSSAPVQPMFAVKNAVTELTTLMDELESDDQLSLEVYDTHGHHEVNLTTEFSRISNRLNEMQAGYYGSYTNMGAGIARAIEELTGPRARSNAVKVIFLLTDGKPNVSESGYVGDYEAGGAFARAMAETAVGQHIQIYTVTVGADADQSLMHDIAELGGGEQLHAEGSIDEYTDRLLEIFRRLAGARPVVMIE